MPTDLLNTLMVGLQVFLAILGGFLAAFHLAMVIWTFRDIRARSRDAFAHILATALVLFFSLPGLLLYMLLRPRETLAEQYERALEEEALLQDIEERLVCPGCQRKVEPDFVVCPSCQTQLKTQCANCGRLLHPKWTICPYCATSVAPPPPERLTPEPEVAPEPAPATLEEAFAAASVATVATAAASEDDQWQPEEPPAWVPADDESAADVETAVSEGEELPEPVLTEATFVGDAEAMASEGGENDSEEVPAWVRPEEEEPSATADTEEAASAEDDENHTEPFPDWVWPQGEEPDRTEE